MRSMAIVLALLLSSACSTFALRYDRCPAYPAPADPEANVTVQYLGSGGYLVKRGEDVVLFGPVYSNPSGIELVANNTIRTDQALVDLLLPQDGREKTDAIVIGHGHADHAMDTPYIANRWATTANVYGSATVKNLIYSAMASNRVVDVGPAALSETFIQINSRLRLWPIPSRHSDQTRLTPKILFFGVGINLPLHMWRGEVDKPLSTLPATASEWAEGQVYAYVLDFMDSTGKNVEFRVYYQDSGTDYAVGYPWGGKTPPDGKKIDVVLLCVGGDFERLDDHPGGIIKATTPRFVVLGHWEDFFKPQTDICRIDKVMAIPHFKMNEFLGEAREGMKDAKVAGSPILACPTASIFNFPVEEVNGDKAVHDAIKKSPAKYDCSKVFQRERRDR